MVIVSTLWKPPFKKRNIYKFFQPEIILKVAMKKLETLCILRIQYKNLNILASDTIFMIQ